MTTGEHACIVKRQIRRLTRLIKRHRLLIVFPSAVVIIGTIGFMFLEDLSLIDAFYFTIVTISTVGYGDINPTSLLSKLFSILLIVTGIGIFLSVVTTITQNLVQRRQRGLHRERLNMIIGVFFTEVGDQLLHMVTRYDPNIAETREGILEEENWEEPSLTRLRRTLRRYEYTVSVELMDLHALKDFLADKGSLLLRQAENPDIIEHESFTDVLWSVIHLRDELMSRQSLEGLPESDLTHLALDATRAYGNLMRQWTEYLRHLRQKYPYLYSLAVRTNPFMENPTPVIR